MRLMVVLAIAVLLTVPAFGVERGSRALFDDALRALALTRADLSFRTDYADAPDSFRLSIVDSLLSDPVATEAYVVAAAGRLGSATSLERAVVALAKDLDLNVAAGAADETGSATTEAKPPGPGVLDVLLPALREAAAETNLAFAQLTDDERAFIRDNAAVLLEEDVWNPETPIEERDRQAKEEEELGTELLRIAGHVDFSHIAQSGAILARAVDLAIPLAEAMAVAPPLPDRTLKRGAAGPAAGDVLQIMTTDAGTIVIGGPGRTTYDGAAAVIIDLGGDDVYTGEVGAAGPGCPASVLIDLAGNDTYLGTAHSLGAAFMGSGILIDLAGDDQYSAGSFSIGSGLFGVGILLDRAGNDSYSGDTCTEGSGAFGIGIHIDGAGNDSYRAALFSQAFGFVAGAGLLRDDDGNDVYVAGGKYTDEIRYFDHYTSLSQGFGFGWRPVASGGIGLLVDGAGNDVYVSDIFGQGASYWFSVGGLVDRAGNDQYVSYQYAQGAATHITVAALVDMAGDDNYVSKGVSQGCGHDLAIGILHDLAGNDNYTAYDLSQAAGNANGIGILMDDAGNDSYSVRDPNNTHGYGNLRRDYGSVGVLIDGAGKDSYGGRGSDGTWWSYSTYGIGIDAPEEGSK
jgi:hypothetical protein